MANRTEQLGGIWADGAPVPPTGTTPSAGTTYADPTLDLAGIEAGWPYSSVVDSASFNEMMRRITTLLNMLEEQGLLTFCAATTYSKGAKVLGSDGNMYHSIADTNLNHDPVSSPTYWTCNPLYAVAAGTDTYTASLIPTPTALVAGLECWIKITGTNTGAATLALNSLGAKAIKQTDGTAVVANQLNGIVHLIYNGTAWECQSPPPSAAGVTPAQVQNQAFTYSPDTGGSANTYSATYSPAITAPVDGMVLGFKAAHSNSGASTFQPNSVTVHPIVGQNGSALTANAILANNNVVLMYDSTLTSWILLFSVGAAASMSSGEAGMVAHFAMITPPAGWLKANGAAVSRDTYAALFAAIGTTFGVGNGSTTFTLPDLRSEFARGLDDGRNVDVGRTIGTNQIGSLVGFTADSTSLTVTPATSDATLSAAQASLGVDAYDTGDYSADVGLIITGSGTKTALPGTPSSEHKASGIVRPRNVALLACIKY